MPHLRSKFWTTCSLILCLVAWPAAAETVPPHLAKMAASLLKELDTAIQGVEAGSPQAEILKKADGLLRTGYVRNWQNEPFHKSARLRQALQEMLAEKEFSLTDAQTLLTQIMQLGPKEGLKQFYAVTSRPAVDDKTLTDRSQKIEVLMKTMWKDMSTNFALPIDKGQQLKLEWDPPKGNFSMVAEDDGSKSGTPFSTRFEGKVTPSPNSTGDDIDFTVTPAPDPIRPQSPQDVKRDEQVKAVALQGVWIDETKGDVWEFSGSGAKAPITPAAEKSLGANKAALQEQVKQLQNQKRYVWKHASSGKEEVQEKFQKLSNDYKYVGETVPDSVKQQITALEEQIKKADSEKANTPLIEQHDPVGYAGAAGKAPLTIKVTQKDGYSFTYDSAFMDGSNVTARRVLRDKRDISDLPEDVVSQLLASWAPPEWIKAKVEYQEPSGKLRMNVQWWRLNVTYDGQDHKVKSIHTPFDKAITLTRQTEHKEVDLYFTDEKGAKVLDVLPYGAPLTVNAQFTTPPEEATRAVRVSWNGAGTGMTWVMVKRSSDPKIYKSDVVTLTPPGGEQGVQGDDRIKL